MAGSSKKAIYAALFGNAGIAVTKFAAALMTGSSAMFAEGVHSVTDTGNQLLLLHGIRRSKKPPSERFPFGHGKEVYFWSFVVAILLFALGAGVSVFKGVSHILHPEPMESAGLNYLVIVVSVVFEGLAWGFALREFSRSKGKWGYIEAVHRGKDPSIFLVLFEDSAAILGLFVAFLGIFLSRVTGNPVFDGAASVVIGLILGGTAVWLAWETKGLLIGESANQPVVDGIRSLCAKMEAVEHVNEVLTLHMGPQFILVCLSVDFRDPISASEMEKAISTLDGRIKERFPRVKKVFVEAEARSEAMDAC